MLCSVLGTSFLNAQNPIIQTSYTADPAPMVHDDKLYLYTSHDEDNSTWFTMDDWRLYTTEDMVNWTDHGAVLEYTDFDWALKNAWAPAAIERDGKFYIYVPITDRSNQNGIGVAVSDSPYGPFIDPLGKPLVSESNADIDPAVFIDDDGQVYMFWGNPECYFVKLNEDMISIKGDIGYFITDDETVNTGDSTLYRYWESGIDRITQQCEEFNESSSWDLDFKPVDCSTDPKFNNSELIDNRAKYYQYTLEMEYSTAYDFTIMGQITGHHVLEIGIADSVESAYNTYLFDPEDYFIPGFGAPNTFMSSTENLLNSRSLSILANKSFPDRGIEIKYTSKVVHKPIEIDTGILSKTKSMTF